MFNDACIYSVDEDPNGEDVYMYIYFWLCWVFIMAHELFIAAHGLALDAVNGVYFLVMVCGLLIVMASFCGAWALDV